ncbi:tRNA-specific 2-thiouridylase MnmA [Citrifermentans bremense]|uniref:tRNA-specific 2-thiouridylase MnmA n=1 Tax=Citrifermentans bremense TaxID=60035 RepID=A0A6S6LW00_9BACT|nr:tRNA 2-thiouridine(34) synthase MnmA [Citrifermentans bremense]BCG46197.1 tRNA-specific 2-thiouridylase MnmA [Citrifermentans bremense]
MSANFRGKKVAVAMSGGVDSSTVAALLKEQGAEVIGINMKLFAREGEDPGAKGDAQVVAEYLGIEFHLVHLEEEFSRIIMDDFRAQYLGGETPNPCVRCNRYVKFGLLLDKALELGAEYLATGHYVKTSRDEQGTYHLLKAAFLAKDQSYFLYTLTQRQLAHVIFPLGDMPSKDEVRRLAEKFGLPVAQKSDSQEICFVPGDDYVAFLEKGGRVAGKSGDIVHVDGAVLGRHNGTHRYTIGQRRGLGVAWKEPLYVVSIDAAQGKVVVGEAGHLFAEGLLVCDLNWVVPVEGDAIDTTCKIRYRQQPIECRVRLLGEGLGEVFFIEPQKSVTPGQSVVFYREDELLGGGRIVRKM